MRGARAGFSMVELLVVIAVVAILVAVLAPSLSRAREAARTGVCLSNQHQLIVAWNGYSADYRDRVMPLAYWEAEDIGSGEQVFWWGTHGTLETPPRHGEGFIAPYLSAGLAKGSVFECPAQAWGTYRAQGPGARWVTSTYGYNGYYLSPAKTPGWGMAIGFRPWRRLGEIRDPSEVLVFADTLMAGSTVSNNALLDPPRLYGGAGVWTVNTSPTTCFRHGGAAAGARADGSVRTDQAQGGWIRHEAGRIGSVGIENDPRYVPDWREW